MSTDAVVRDQTVIAWLTAAEAAVSDRADYLTQLDAAIGDGDHGINMNRGMSAVAGKLDDSAGETHPTLRQGQGAPGNMTLQLLDLPPREQVWADP